MNGALPAGWTRSSVGDLADLVMGQSPPGHTYNNDGSGLPFFQGKAEFGELHPTTRKWCSEPNKIAFPGDVLISVRAPVGPTNLAREECCIGRGLAAIRPRRGISSRYLLWYLRSTERALAELGTGSTFSAISGEILRSFTAPLAPTNEQRRIVAAIEEHLSDLEAAVRALERGLTNFARLRDSVLDKVFHVTDWEWAPLGTLVTGGPDNGLYLPKSDYGSGTPIIRIDDFQDFWSRSANKLRRVRANPETEAAYSVEVGDLLINRVNSPSHLGKCLVIEPRHVPAVFESNMMRLRLGHTTDPRFVAMFLRSRDGRARLTSNAKWAVNQASINQKDVCATLVPVPSLSQQREVVADLDHRLTVAERTAAEIDVQLARAARLRQSILKRAFEGKLVPQDPSDEPASALLERIRADASVTPASPRRRAQRTQR